jgi:chromosomal replication initiator protein
VILDEQFWNQIKSQIRSRNRDNKMIETWLEPIRFVELVQTGVVPKLVLGVPTSLHQYFVLENLLERIYAEISEIWKSPFEVDLVVSSSGQSQQEATSLAEALQQTPEIKQQPHLHQNAHSGEKQRDFLNAEYTFSTFVVGRNTEFAHAASYNVAQNPGADGYNPLFLCGPVGMGKTHLLQAVGNHVRTIFPNLRVNYISAERFLNECVSAIRRQEMDKFRNKYRENSDVLLVDDVQYIGRGEATQEEFFHMINSFLERKKQVVIASDRMPKDILNIEDRNRSRLEWGLITDISMPDLETRVAILRYKAERLGLRLTEDVINYVARISKRSIRELEGNLKKIKMFSELQGLNIDLSLARRVLANHETQTTISMDDIQKMVADHYKIRISDLKSTSRAKQVVVPRQVSMFLIKKHLDKSLVDIGRYFGGKDHTTVINALGRVDYLLSKNMEIKNDIEELTTRIQNITGL